VDTFVDRWELIPTPSFIALKGEVMATWEVELFISGPITIGGRIRLNDESSLHLGNPFYTDIDLRRVPSGVLANLRAPATSNQLANQAALLFGGRMLDALAININLSLFVSLFERRISERRVSRTDGSPVKRIVEQKEWHAACELSHLLAEREPTFLRALGWYRKGLYTEDPFDSFLAFWTSIEIVASKYHPSTNRAKTGSKSQIWESFKDLWGDIDEWPVIKGDTHWIDRNHEIRNHIAHGVASIDVRQVETVVEKLGTIKRVAHTFLKDWKMHKLKLKDNSPTAALPETSTLTV